MQVLGKPAGMLQLKAAVGLKGVFGMIKEILNYSIVLSLQTTIIIIIYWLLALTTWIVLLEYDKWREGK